MSQNINFYKSKNNFNKYKNIKSNLLLNPNGELENKYRYSITIPTFKRPYELLEAINSCINQSYIKNDWQIVVVDNNPEFDTEIRNNIKKLSGIPNLFYYKNEQNIGMFGNWNRCIELALGEYMVILSDDDILKPNFLYEMDAFLKRQPGTNIIYSFYDYFGSGFINTKKIRWRKRIAASLLTNRFRKLTLLDYFLRSFGFSASGMLFKRSLAIKLGGYDDEIFPSADYYFQAKYVNQFGKAILINKILASYRIEKNESMKYEVCDLMPDMHYAIKNKMIKYISLPSKPLKELALLLYLRDMKSMKKLYGHDFTNKIKSNDKIRKLCNRHFKLKYLYLFELILRKLRTLSFFYV